MCLEKLPSVLQLSSLRRPVRFSAERQHEAPPNSQWGGNYLTEREILLEYTDNRLWRVWALDKTQKHCKKISGKSETKRREGKCDITYHMNSTEQD